MNHPDPWAGLGLPEDLARRLEEAGYRSKEDLQAAEGARLREVAGPEWPTLQVLLGRDQEVHDVGDFLAPPPFET